MSDKIFLCKKCLTLSTRPRVVYNKDGVCNACVWVEKKKTIDWDKRSDILMEYCDRFRCDDGSYDMIVPCSGGKDGSYVAYMMKQGYGMHPLCYTLSPQLPTEIGIRNLQRFIEHGYDHIKISPDWDVYRRLAKKGFVEQGRPKLPFVMGISTVCIQLSRLFNIPFVMWGEEGETEYGGTTKTELVDKITYQYLVDYYYSGHNPKEYLDEFTSSELYWWSIPDDLDKLGMFHTHYSKFKDWSPSTHYQVASDKCGFKPRDGRSVGTYTNYAQLDDKLQDLHAYMMKVKFGFGRCWSDACIDIRAGKISRDEGIHLVKQYDNEFPFEYLDDYLNYFNMTDKEFWKVIDGFRPKNVWKKVDDVWVLRFEIK